MSLPQERSTAEQVFYTWVARSCSGSSSFTASALNKLSSWVARSRSESSSFTASALNKLSSSSSSSSWCSITAPAPFFLFWYLLLHVHTLYSLITHLLTHTVATSCVFVLAHSPALGSAYSGVLALDSFAPTCRARVRKEAGSYSYDYPSYSSDA